MSSQEGGGITGWSDLSLPGWLTELKNYADTLVEFARSPLRFLRGRVIPPILGAIFGFAFDLADIVSRPFQAVIGALATTSRSLTNASQSVAGPISNALALSAEFIVSLTAPLGPLQPFAAGALTLLLAYGVLVLAVRTIRAVSDSVPVLASIETFFFG